MLGSGTEKLPESPDSTMTDSIPPDTLAENLPDQGLSVLFFPSNIWNPKKKLSSSKNHLVGVFFFFIPLAAVVDYFDGNDTTKLSDE